MHYDVLDPVPIPAGRIDRLKLLVDRQSVDGRRLRPDRRHHGHCPQNQGTEKDGCQRNRPSSFQ